MYIVPPAGVRCSLEVAKIQTLGHHAFLHELSDLLLTVTVRRRASPEVQSSLASTPPLPNLA